MTAFLQPRKHRDLSAPWNINLFVIIYFCRCFQIFKTVRVIRGIQQQDPDNTQRYRLYISMLHDLSITGVVEAFTEEAPQVRISGDSTAVKRKNLAPLPVFAALIFPRV